MTTIEAGIAAVDLFADLRPRQLEALGQNARLKKHRRGSMVVEEGDAGHSLYILLSGSVAIRKQQPSGEFAVLGTARTGEHFGEMSLLDGLPRSADVICLEDSEFVVIERGDFARCIESNSGLAMKVMASLCKRLRESTGAMVSDRPVRERLATLLLEVARRESVRTAQGHLRFRLPYSRQLLAQEVRARRETVSRELRKLADTGALAIRGREILVDEARMSLVAGEGSV